jgi:hypothetical protein
MLNIKEGKPSANTLRGFPLLHPTKQVLRGPRFFSFGYASGFIPSKRTLSLANESLKTVVVVNFKGYAKSNG